MNDSFQCFEDSVLNRYPPFPILRATAPLREALLSAANHRNSFPEGFVGGEKGSAEIPTEESVPVG